MVIQILKALFLSMMESITMWLPISTSAHMVIIRALLAEDNSTYDMVVLSGIMLGAFVAVLIAERHALNPFAKEKDAKQKRITMQLWLKLLLAGIPILFVKLFVKESVISNQFMIIALLVFGIVLVVVRRKPRYHHAARISYPKTLFAGIMQCLVCIPGVSRMAVMMSSMYLLGFSRTASTELALLFSIPVLLTEICSILRQGILLSVSEGMILLMTVMTSFLFSSIVINSLRSYVKKHSFRIFGFYQIALGIMLWLLTLSGMITM